MDVRKRGVIVVVLVLVLVVILGSYLFFSDGGITGGVIGLGSELPVDNSSLITIPAEDNAHSAVGDNSSDKSTDSSPITLPEEDSVREETNGSSLVTIPSPVDNDNSDKKYSDKQHNEEDIIANETREMILSTKPITVSATQLISRCTSLRTAGDIYQLANDLTNVSTCIEILASHVTLDCRGFNITYSTNGSINQYGVLIDSAGTGFHNNTVRNCEINAGALVGSDQAGIRLDNSNNNSLINNSIRTFLATSRPIRFTNSSDNWIENNTLLSFGSSSFGILLSTRSHRNMIRYNNITTLGTSADGIQLITIANDFNYIEGNKISCGNNLACSAINLVDANQTYLINNNLSARGFEIEDNTDAANTNFLIYNDSFVELMWVNNGSGNFYENLSLNSSEGIGLGLNLFFANNTFALNMSDFLVPTRWSRFNSSINITFKGLTFGTINELRRTDDIIIDRDVIMDIGYNCSSDGGVLCQIRSYSGGILQFNATGFGSFTANFSPADTRRPIATIVYPTNGTEITSRIYYNINITVNEIANVTLNDTRWTLIAVNDGRFFNFTNNTALGEGVFHLKAYVNDSSNNNGSANFNFIRGTKAPIVKALFPTKGSTLLSINYYNINISTDDISNVSLNDSRWTLIQNTDSRSFNFTNNTALANGNYDIKVYASDYLGNNGSINISFIKSGCQELTNSLTLTEDVSFPGTCFYIMTSNITLDCNGFNITYATNSSSNQNGILIDSVGPGFNNNTVRDCEINSGAVSGNSRIGIEIDNSNNNSLINNTIKALLGTNRLIRLINSSDNWIENNTLFSAGSSSLGILLSTRSHRNLIRYNNITTTGTSSDGIQLAITANDFNYIEGNKISTKGMAASLIHLLFANQTYLINNNLSSSGSSFSIEDDTSAANTNFLIYNDSFVDLRWVNNGSGNYYENLTTNGTLGLGLSIFFANNTFAFNITEFQTPARWSKINSSANITFKGLAFGTINELRRVENFTTNNTIIFDVGYNCSSTGGVLCQIHNYSDGILRFNTTGFSSFTAGFTLLNDPPAGSSGGAAPSAPAPAAPSPPAPAPLGENVAIGEIGFYTPPEVRESREEGITLGEATVVEVGEAAVEAAGERSARRGEMTAITPKLTIVNDIEQFRKIRTYKIVLENKGVKKMRLFPRLFQDIDDPFFIVTRKTLGYSDSLFERITSLSYSTTPVAGRLLEAEILNPEQIILNPGEKIEKIIAVKEGLAMPDEIKIQFFTGEEVVFEQDIKVEAKIFSGTAIDIDDDNNKIDIYTFIVPPFAVGRLEEYYAQSAVTGAAVYNDVQQSDVYQLEITLRKKRDDAIARRSIMKRLIDQLFGTKTYFADLYGPYTLKKEQIFVFAQQLDYDPETYAGDYILETTIFRQGEVYLQGEFEVTLR